MTARVPQRVSVAESIYRRLRDSILHGELRPGDTLPGERVLSEELNANRAAVREALKRLEQSRLVSIHQGGNTRICDYRTTATLEIVGQLLVDDEGHVDAKVARSMIELRAAISPDLARLAAERSPEACASELGVILEEMRSGADDVSRLRTLGEAFWGALGRHSENIAYQLILNTVREVHDAHAKLLERMLAQQYRDISFFAALHEAMLNKDAIAAHRIARDRSNSILKGLGQQPVVEGIIRDESDITPPDAS